MNIYDYKIELSDGTLECEACCDAIKKDDHYFITNEDKEIEIYCIGCARCGMYSYISEIEDELADAQGVLEEIEDLLKEEN